MNQVILALFALCALIGFSSAAAPPSERYTDKYDSIDYKNIMKNDRLLDSYFKCLMDQGHCTADASELKGNLADALTNKCSKCSAKQKTASEEIIRFLIKEKPEMWAKLEGKYDPKGIYRATYKDELNKLTKKE